LTLARPLAYSSAMSAARRALAGAVLLGALGAHVALAVDPPDVTMRRTAGSVRLETGAASARIRLGRWGLQLRDRVTRRLLTAERRAGGLFYERGADVHGLGRVTDVATLPDGVRLTVATDGRPPRR
jgi:hypothetical protein